MNRTATAVAGGLIIVTAGVVFVTVNGWGFPDGHLTDLERALRPLGYVFVWVSILVGFGLLLLRRFRADSGASRYGWVVLIAYVVFAVSLLIVRVYLGRVLNDGMGG